MLAKRIISCLDVKDGDAQRVALYEVQTMEITLC